MSDIRRYQAEMRLIEGLSPEQAERVRRRLLHAQDLAEALVAANTALIEIARDEGPMAAFAAGIAAEMWLRAMGADIHGSTVFEDALPELMVLRSRPTFHTGGVVLADRDLVRMAVLKGWEVG